eukprot:Clim_evm10s22 gene=Clim_evmTU10s22
MSPPRFVAAVVNISEGRNRQVLDRLVKAIEHTCTTNKRSALIRTFFDFEYHRSSFTIGGELDAVASAVLSLCREACRTIDLMQQHMEGALHPRRGVADLVPFYPLGDDVQRMISDPSTQSEVRKFGALLSQQCQIGVMYFGALDHRKHRTLPQRRKEIGWFKHSQDGAVDWASLVDAIDEVPNLADDQGNMKPTVLPSRGICAVGMVPFVMNCNYGLSTDDLAVGKELARRVRQAGKLETMAFMHNGAVEVACNVLAAHDQSEAEVRQLLDGCATDLNTTVTECLTVGLSPGSALSNTQKALAKYEID